MKVNSKDSVQADIPGREVILNSKQPARKMETQVSNSGSAALDWLGPAIKTALANLLKDGSITAGDTTHISLIHKVMEVVLSNENFERTEGLWNTAQVAQFLNLTPRGIEAMRLRGGGPPYCRLGRSRVSYFPADVRQWARARVKSSTSDE